ncbi:phosphatase PAP2 family protein [Nocardia transvalensis]|uniref:phosphatase PAP2 family protein n=1 Tax=Nocardia transvalensis TaxID=37333 RepID=UPI0018958A08|nr:phosphatase PAP2 family protein [Nocardia transvalensis]MBF6329709.1 phosphatase PAP2 family protein [Nocardia transvalensis]
MALLTLALLTAVVAVVLVRRGTLQRGGAGGLISMAALTGGIVDLTDHVVDDDGATAMDPAAIEWVVSHRRSWLTPIALSVTELGSETAMTAVAVAACAWFAWRRQWPRLVLTATVSAGAGITSAVMKILVGRERPPEADRLAVVTSQAFPSGHALGAAAVVGIVAALTVPTLRQRIARLTVAAAATLFVLAVGLSRVYLAVHWPTDVLAGWAIGLLWTAVGLSVHLSLHRLRVDHRSPVPRAGDSLRP